MVAPRESTAAGVVFGLIALIFLFFAPLPSAEATVPGQNGKIVYTDYANPVTLRTVDPARSPLRPRTLWDEELWDASIGPDGRTLAASANSGLQLLRMHKGSALATPLTVTDNYDMGATFAPDGQSVFFTRAYERSDFTSIMEVGLDGVSRTVAESEWSMGISAISPDGRTLAFITEGGPQPGLHLMNSDGTNDRLFGLVGVGYGGACFSPDGSEIVFSRNVAESGINMDLFVARLDGSEVRQLTSSPSNEVSPVFSPNGKQIAYGTYDIPPDFDPLGNPNSRYGVGVMDRDGSDSRPITAMSVQAGSPDWGRKAPFVVKAMKAKKDRAVMPVRLFGPGRLQISGPGIRKAGRRVERSGTVLMPITAKSGLKKRISRKGKARVPLSVSFKPDGALRNTISRRIVLKDQKQK